MGYKLLLADDSITIQKVVGIIFANEDYDLAVVDNGTAALEKAREILPDVILVDALMPGMSGYDVCREVRKDRLLSRIPILLLVGAFEPFDEEKARNSGADDHLSKPFESQNLIEKVKSLLKLGEERAKAAVHEEFAPQGAPSAHAPFFAGASFPHVDEVAGIPSGETAKSGRPVTGIDSLGAVEAEPGDDLWGAFEILDAVEGEDLRLGEELDENEQKPEIVDTVEEIEPFVFREEAEEEGPLAAPEHPVAPGAGTAETGGFPSGEEPVFEGVEVFSPGVNAIEVSEVLGQPRESAADHAWVEMPAFETAPSETLFPGDLEPPREIHRIHEAPGTGSPEDERHAASTEAFPSAAAYGEPTAGRRLEAGSVTISEEQLAVIVARVSREVIEKIAWEVVPDLAETIIREEIRKIREGF